MNFIAIILCVSLFGFSSAVAQPGTVDSLESILDEVSGSDRIPVLARLAEELQREQPAAAIRYSSQALALLERYPDRALQVDVLFNKTWAHYSLNEYDSLLTHAHKIRQIARATGRPEYRVRALLLAARFYRQRGEYEQGIARLDSALTLNIEQTNFLQPLILNELGSICRRQGRSKEALEYHQQALEVMNQLNDRAGIATTLGYIGIMHDIMAHYDEALRAHQQALELREELNDQRGVAASLTNIGIIYQKLANYDDALDFYERAKQVWDRMGLKAQQAATLNNMGAVYELQRLYKKALEHYREAFTIWDELDDRYSVSIALSNMGAIHMHLGEYRPALEFQQRALQNRQMIGDQYGSASTLLDIAEVYHKRGMPDSALVAARQSLALAEETGSWSLLRDIHEMLFTIFEAQQEYEQALSHFRSFKTAEDSIFNSERQSVIAELQEQYRTREQQQRIELLQQTQEVQSLWLGILVGGVILVTSILGLLYNRYKLRQRAHEALEQLHKTEIEKAELRTKAAEAISNYFQAENERKTQELEAARELQLSLLPSEVPQPATAEISAFMQTAAEVGGDYYDFFPSGDESLTIVLGDATGHGTKAGTLVTATKSLLNLLAREENLVTILQRTSHGLKKMNFRKLYMAMALVRLKDHTIELAGAGIPPALLYRANTRKVEQIPLKGMPLAGVPEYPYRQTTITVEEGDALLLATDGLPELTNEEGLMFGYERMPRILMKCAEESPEQIIHRYREEAKRWLNGTPQQDDFTFIALKIKG
ncbi:tetratricopeptide repeat protein [Halalkalibaculum sp. DA384]|uniref:tetratricopeptide repeat protein n=1 Tax=Halalkalibaculum sp. DA384 TaxID=3373606 RepID=UPI0037545DBD